MYCNALVCGLSILIFAACSGPEPEVPRRPGIDLYADPEFTLWERAQIEVAARRLEAATSVHYQIAYLPGTGNRLMRLAGDSLLVAGLDIQFSGSVYGATTRLKPFQIFLVADRMETSSMWIHVALHELAHGAGAEHVKDPTAVMYERTCPGQYEAQWLNETDLREFTRASVR